MDSILCDTFIQILLRIDGKICIQAHGRGRRKIGVAEKFEEIRPLMKQAFIKWYELQAPTELIPLKATIKAEADEDYISI